MDSLTCINGILGIIIIRQLSGCPILLGHPPLSLPDIPIFTSQVIARLPLYNALTTYEAQTGEMQISKLDQPL